MKVGVLNRQGGRFRVRCLDLSEGFTNDNLTRLEMSSHPEHVPVETFGEDESGKGNDHTWTR